MNIFYRVLLFLFTSSLSNDQKHFCQINGKKKGNVSFYKTILRLALAPRRPYNTGYGRCKKLIENETFSLLPLPPLRHSLTTREVFETSKISHKSLRFYRSQNKAHLYAVRAYYLDTYEAIFYKYF